MGSVHRACTDVAARFRGVVARILGDSILSILDTGRRKSMTPSGRSGRGSNSSAQFATWTFQTRYIPMSA